MCAYETQLLSYQNEKRQPHEENFWQISFSLWKMSRRAAWCSGESSAIKADNYVIISEISENKLLTKPQTQPNCVLLSNTQPAGKRAKDILPIWLIQLVANQRCKRSAGSENLFDSIQLSELKAATLRIPVED